MKERGILFSAEMVRAILDDLKTQTRRVVLPQPALGASVAVNSSYICVQNPTQDHARTVHCPFGQIGDRLWVRETFYCDHYAYPDAPIGEMQELLCYRADGEWNDHVEDGGPSEWRPSIHMPRWASRITLEITRIRVGRVQQIVPADAAAEAAGDVILNTKHPLRAAAYERGRNVRGVRFAGIIQGYAALWDSLNAKRGYGWEANPWVWVIEFKRIEQQQAAA